MHGSKPSPGSSSSAFSRCQSAKDHSDQCQRLRRDDPGTYTPANPEWMQKSGASMDEFNPPPGKGNPNYVPHDTHTDPGIDDSFFRR